MAWSDMIKEKIPKLMARARTPGEPEIINVLEPAVELDLESTSASKILTVSSVDRTDVQLSRITNIPHSGRIRSLYTSRACEECGRHTSDCLHVRLVLKGLGLRVDERDLSMHSCFKDELKQLMRDAFDQRTPASPRVFIGQKYVAGG